MEVREQLKEIIEKAKDAAIAAGELPEGEYAPMQRLEVPKSKEFGDYSTNASMRWANMQSSNIEKEDGDADGPFDLGVAITEKLDDDKETQIVYYSTANLMESQVNQMVSGGNEKLLLESLNWMTSTDDSNSVSIPSKSLESTSLTVTDYDAAFWKICTIGLIPGVFLVAGFLIWLKRRKA